MLVKKFVAENYVEALQRVKRELGEDALVLATRSLKSGAEGAAGSTASRVEITAALEREPQTQEASSLRRTKPRFSQGTNWAESMAQRPDWEEWLPMFQSLLTRTERAQAVGLRADQMDLFNRIVKNGVEEKWALRFFEFLNTGRFPVKDASRPPGPVDIEAMAKRLVRCGGGIVAAAKGPHIVALVGPTGVGKTTTIAKLAAHFAHHENLRVAMVSLDSFRLGAFDQIRAFGDLMKVPVEGVAGRLDFRRIVQKHADKQLILVDTTGKSRKDQDHVRQLGAVFGAVGEVEVHLVQSITSEVQVLNETFTQFAPLNPHRMLFTKLDEGVRFGALLNCAIRWHLPFSYFTTGQRVPEDLEVVRKDRVIRLIFD